MNVLRFLRRSAVPERMRRCEADPEDQKIRRIFVFLFGLFLVKNLFTDQELSVRILADVKNLFYALIAQSVEHAAVNRGVTGSSPV